MTTLASALVLAAQLAGPGAAPVDAPQVPQLPPPQPLQQPAMPELEPVKLGEVPLEAVLQRQAQAVFPVKVGPAAVELSVAFPSADAASVAFRQAGKTQEVALSDLASKPAVELPYGHYKAAMFAGQLELTNQSGDYARAKLSLVFEKTMQKAAQLQFDPVVYGALLEGTADAPASLALVRRDQNGQYWVAWHSADELKQIVWLLAVDGKMFGVKLEGAKLAVYGKPVPALPMTLLMDGAKALSLK